MDIGLLLGVNLFSVPFIYETEILGKQLGKFPSFFKIISLKNTWNTRWFKLYCVFMLIFFVIAIFPSKSGKTYTAGSELILLILLIQVILWVLVYIKVAKFNNVR
jgi:hypothetical protein